MEQMSDKTWNILSIVIGAGVGVGIAQAMLNLTSMFGSMLALIIAFAAVIWIPNAIERQTGRKLTFARIAMLATGLIIAWTTLGFKI